MTYSKDDRFKYSIIDVASRLHGAVSGTGDPLTEELLEQVEWLVWRIGAGWMLPEGKHREYERAVWNLAFSAVAEAAEMKSARGLNAQDE